MLKVSNCLGSKDVGSNNIDDVASQKSDSEGRIFVYPDDSWIPLSEEARFNSI
jgi:hypothetical protein